MSPSTSNKETPHLTTQNGLPSKADETDETSRTLDSRNDSPSNHNSAIPPPNLGKSEQDDGHSMEGETIGQAADEKELGTAVNHELDNCQEDA